MLRSKGIWSRLLGFRNTEPPAPEPLKTCTHVILLDGTMSTLTPGNETNIGLMYRLLMQVDRSAGLRIYYEPGIQWRGLTRSHEVLAGVGINRQIRRAFVWLSHSYRPGDRVMLLGYSRGAYAARSLAGFIDNMGLMHRAALNQERVEALYELYREAPDSVAAEAMRAQYCRPAIPIAFMGAFDTVRALGVRWPLIWRLLPLPHPYHNHSLGPRVEVARHALALDETRVAYDPILWDTSRARAEQDVVQMWFRGSHGDIGGQLNGLDQARPRSNIPLVWMLEELERAGLPLPKGWHSRYQTDPTAPSIGTFAGIGKLLWMRRRRVIGRDPSERVHPTAKDWASAKGLQLGLTHEPPNTAVPG